MKRSLYKYSLVLITLLLVVCHRLDALAWTITEINSANQAKQYVESLLTNEYIDLTPNDEMEISENEGIWKCFLTTQNGVNNLKIQFDHTGRLIEFICDKYPVHCLEGVSLAADLDILPKKQFELSNRICDLLFPGDIWCSGYVIGYSDAFDEHYCTIVGDGFNSTLSYYFVFKLEPIMQLVGFGDLRQPTVRYGAYLSRKEAEEIAQEAVRQTYSNAKYCELKISQAEFVTSAGYFNEGQVDVPFWFVVINDGNEEYYEICIDAKDGTVQELLDSTTGGKG